ncbi:MAG: aminopeptidase P N-terminal domain-containing protein [Pseudomonadota bacterium]
MLNKAFFEKNREHLLSQLASNSIAVLFNAPVYLRTCANYPYRYNNDFYYITGMKEPEAVAVFLKGEHEVEYLLFQPQRDEKQELFEGRVGTEKELMERHGIHHMHWLHELNERMPELLRNKECLYYPYGRDAGFDARMQQWMNRARLESRQGVTIPHEIFNIETLIHEMRFIKTPEEISILQTSANIAAQAQMQIMQACKPGMYEYELEAIFVGACMKKGARYMAYESIVAGGNNACTLHYIQNSDVLNAGDLVLIDAGCEYQSYASDITRTFPVNGQFTPEQKAIYELVLEVQLAAIAKAKPGNTWYDCQAIAIRTITEGLIDLGLLEGSVDELIENETYKQFYYHKIGHWIGMDVHDVGAYKIKEDWRVLQPNIVMTIEPGIYISKDADVDERWKGIGIRIEDDVLLTKEGNTILTADVPKQIEEIEAIVGVGV